MKLHIEKLIYGGAGLAHQEDGPGAGTAVFVPFTLPGEQVEAQLSAESAGYLQGSLTQVIHPSHERIEARCRHFMQCGGCHLQHADYPAQVTGKAAILNESLERAGLTARPQIKIHTAEPWAYRNRIRLRIALAEGTLQLGYHRRGGNDFLPIEECPIASPLLWRASSALLHLMNSDKVTERWMRDSTDVEFFGNASETKLQMTLFMHSQPSSGFDKLCTALRLSVPELIGAGTSISDVEPRRRHRRAENAVPGASWGSAGLLYIAATTDHWVSRGGFFQVNRYLVDEMVRVVTQGREGRLAWDLYAGVGLFSRSLAKTFEQVVAVEAGQTAAADLSRALKGTGGRAIHATTVEFLRSAVVQRERPDLIVLDPPRAGVGAEVCALLVRLKTAELVYVSCDPVTLARDLQLLTESGYQLAELHLVDMFPQTFHIETIAILRC